MVWLNDSLSLWQFLLPCLIQYSFLSSFYINAFVYLSSQSFSSDDKAKVDQETYAKNLKTRELARSMINVEGYIKLPYRASDKEEQT